jgi:hypothetical protein
MLSTLKVSLSRCVCIGAQTHRTHLRAALYALVPKLGTC